MLLKKKKKKTNIFLFFFPVGRTIPRLWWGIKLQSWTGHASGRALGPRRHGRESAGKPDLDCQQWRDQLSRKAGDHERGTVHPGGISDRSELYQYRSHQWNELLLCG